MKDNILIIQETLMRQINRLDDDKEMGANARDEIARANAISNSALTYLKSINVKLAIETASEGSAARRKELSKYVGVTSE